MECDADPPTQVSSADGTLALGSSIGAKCSILEDVRSIVETESGADSAQLLPLLEQLASTPRATVVEVLLILDSAAMASNPRVATRLLASIANVLAFRAISKGASAARSCEATHDQFKAAITCLRNGDIVGGVRALACARALWMAADEPDKLMRASYQYEGAAAECISLCVRSCPLPASAPLPPPALDEWIQCEAAARVDLAGGWSDTPPLCYEAGGRVVNAAVTIDGDRPIGARARRLREPVVRLSTGDAAVELTTLDELRDFCDPLAVAALPKTVLLWSGLVSLDDARSLESQLSGGGVELHSFSRLPTGSGLGTSSILAGALVAVVGRLMGRDYAHTDLVHAVLQVEQMLTTGGGWQDQVGGIVPGIKRCSSAAKLPLVVETKVLPISAETLSLLNRHILLVYTGTPRLARGLLQDVVRRWHSAQPRIVHNVGALVRTAAEMEDALLRGDVAAVGALLDTYWAQKKVMCDAEPAAVRRMLQRLRPHVHGATLAGAGGGGFMLVVSREPDAADDIARALGDEDGVSVHAAAIDQAGLVFV